MDAQLSQDIIQYAKNHKHTAEEAQAWIQKLEANDVFSYSDFHSMDAADFICLGLPVILRHLGQDNSNRLQDLFVTWIKNQLQTFDEVRAIETLKREL